MVVVFFFKHSNQKDSSKTRPVTGVFCKKSVLRNSALSLFIICLFSFFFGEGAVTLNCRDKTNRLQLKTRCPAINLAVIGVRVFRELEVGWGRREVVCFP